MRAQIQQAVASGNTEQALALLVRYSNDGILLQARYNQAKRQQNMGLIDFGQWSRELASINDAIIQLANTIQADAPVVNPGNGGNGGGSAPVVNAPNAPVPGGGGKKKIVFISYNHGDSDVARNVRNYLEQAGLDVILDEDDMAAGRSIMEFIQDSIRRADAVVSIVSAKSLASGWVGQESVASIYAVWLADKKFIPVRLDNVAFDIDFQITASENLTLKTKDLKAKISKLDKMGLDSPGSRDDVARMTELKNNLGKIIQRLTGVLMLDITGDRFEPSMKKVLAAIQE